RYCIDASNAKTGDDTIIFDPTIFASPETIRLREGALELNDTSGTTTIDGPGANLLTIDGGLASGVFTVSRNAHVVLDSLTIADGQAYSNGGGIDNAGTLRVSNSTLSGNSAQYYGGGISNSGTLTVSNSTLYGNSATHSGGGISNSGTL